MKVLIVDDSEFMRAILKDLIVQSKWKEAHVLEAADGEEAVALYAKEKPELVLLDIVMPKKDGIAVLRDIGSFATSVVIVSSVGEESVIGEAKKLGAKDYIVKPFDTQIVVDKLNTLLP